MSDTFWVDDLIIVTRDGIVGVDAEHQWAWSWTRPSLPDVEHLVRYMPRPTAKWLRGIRVEGAGWTDYPMTYYDPEFDEAKPWPIPRDREQAEQWVTQLIAKEPK